MLFDRNIRNGCKIVKKGEVYECKVFSIKDERFKQESLMDEAGNNIHAEDKLSVQMKRPPQPKSSILMKKYPRLKESDGRLKDKGMR